MLQALKFLDVFGDEGNLVTRDVQRLQLMQLERHVRHVRERIVLDLEHAQLSELGEVGGEGGEAIGGEVKLHHVRALLLHGGHKVGGELADVAVPARVHGESWGSGGYMRGARSPYCTKAGAGKFT